MGWIASLNLTYRCFQILSYIVVHFHGMDGPPRLVLCWSLSLSIHPWDCTLWSRKVASFCILAGLGVVSVGSDTDPRTAERSMFIVVFVQGATQHGVVEGTSFTTWTVRHTRGRCTW